jgi:hypothetical protein
MARPRACAARLDLEVARRADRGLRAVLLGQIHHDPLHQPAGGASDGSITTDGTELTGDLKPIDRIRGEVGMVFQQFNFLPAFERAGELRAAQIW